MQPAYDIADDASGVGGEREVGEAADGNPYYGEQDGIRDRQPLRERQQQADQPEQGGNAKNGLDGLGHVGRWQSLAAAAIRHKANANRRTRTGERDRSRPRQFFSAVDRYREIPVTVISTAPE